MTRLEFIRRKRNLSQEDFADLVGISQGTICRFESWGLAVFKTNKKKTSRPRAETVTKLEAFCGEKIKKLLKELA